MITGYFFTGAVGLACGSFVNALVWRLHKQGESSEGRGKSKGKKGSNTPTSNLQPPTYSILHGRSMCPNCHHQLAWYDLLPVMSWLMLKGKCRYCRKSISAEYPLVELLVSLSAVFSLIFWPLPLGSALSWALFGVWMLILTVMAAMVLYDLKWMLLPNKLVYSFAALVTTFIAALSFERGDFIPITRGILASILLGGSFWLTYQFSKGRWIGGGDVRLGFFLGLLLGPAKTFLAATLASYIGLFIIIILVILKKYKPKMRIPFGPLLLTGTALAFLFGQHVIDWYIRLTGL